MFEARIDSEKLKELPRVQFSGQIVVASSEADILHWLPILIKEPPLGFDTESKPSFKKGHMNGISLLQLANSQLALLVQLKTTGIPDALKNLLEDPNVIKVGAAIHDDIKGIAKFRRFTPNGFIDLQKLAPKFGIEELSVKKLSAVVLGTTISKRQQLSNWETEQLTEPQKVYAATDAWICREIYLKLKSANPNITI